MQGTAKPLRKMPQKESSVATEGWAGQFFVFPLFFLLCAYGSPQVGSDSQQVVFLGSLSPFPLQAAAVASVVHREA